MKRSEITREAIRRSIERSTRASAAIERREVPAGFVRSAKAEQFLAARKLKG